MVHKIWPVPNSYNKMLPAPGDPGSFWENRGDRFHCGIDIYAPQSSPILATEKGVIIESRFFTSPEELSYWNYTYYVVLKTESGQLLKFAEMEDVFVKVGQNVNAGDLLGHVGAVLNTAYIFASSPLYIQNLKKQNNPSMLHFEVFENPPLFPQYYRGGNLFKNEKPPFLLNPADYLKNLRYKAKNSVKENK